MKDIMNQDQPQHESGSVRSLLVLIFSGIALGIILTLVLLYIYNPS